MIRRLPILIPCLIAAAMLLPRAGRAEPLTAFYEVSWAGVPAADLVLSFDDRGPRYRDAVRIKTVGMSHWLTKFSATAHAEGAIGAGGAVEPDRYRAIYDLHNSRGKRQLLDFVARDGGVIAEYGPGDSSHKRRRLAERYRRNVMDPLSALSRLRTLLARGPIRPGARFTLPVFDDSRRLDAIFTVESAGRGDQPVRLHLELRTIASSERKKPGAKTADDDDATREVELTLSRDRLLPLSMRVEVAYLPLVARFDHLCPDFARCDAKRAAGAGEAARATPN